MPGAQWLLSLWARSLCGLLVAFVLAACQSNPTYTTGAPLPASPETFDDGVVRVTALHQCKGYRCSGLELDLKNVSDTPVDVYVGRGVFWRGTSSARVEPLEGAAGGTVALAPGESRLVKVRLKRKPTGSPKAPNSTLDQSVGYELPRSVWCVLDVSAACTRPSVGAAQCAGYARYFAETYRLTRAWVRIDLPYRVGRVPQTLSSPDPLFAVGEAGLPGIRLSLDESAPAPGEDGAFVYKMRCDESCRCSPETEKRQIVKDGLFFPLDED